MKEATGEVNITVTIVIAVATLSVFFFAVLWPTIKNTFVANNKCSDAICNNTVSNGMVTCRYYDKNGTQVGSEFQCVWKG